KDGFKTAEREVEITAGVPKEIAITLEAGPEATAAPTPVAPAAPTQPAAASSTGSSGEGDGKKSGVPPVASWGALGAAGGAGGLAGLAVVAALLMIGTGIGSFVLVSQAPVDRLRPGLDVVFYGSWVALGGSVLLGVVFLASAAAAGVAFVALRVM